MIKEFSRKQKRIIFVRHGQSVANALGIGDSSLSNMPNHKFPLTELGIEQAIIARKKIEDLGFFWDQSFVSTFSRSFETLSIIDSQLKPIVDSRLNEWWRGIWHTMPKEEVLRLYPMEELIREREGWYHYRSPGGQSGSDVELQIRSFISDFLYGCYSMFNTILIVGHGRWEVLFWRLMTEATIDEAEVVKPFDNCSIAVCDGNGFEIL